MGKKIDSAAKIIMEIIGIEEDDVENYEPTYEEVLKICEQAKHDEDYDISFFNMMGLGNAEIVDIYDVLDDVHDYYDESPSYGDHLNASVEDYDKRIKAKMKEDYEVKYARGNVDLDDIQDHSEIRSPKTMSPAIKGTPHFKYEDSEKKRIGVGQRDYEAKYGTGGLLFEDIYNESRKESITKGKISPALKESIKAFETRKRLIENKIIDPKDLDLLNESEDDNYYDYGGENQESFEEGDRVNTPEGKGTVSSVIRDGDDYYYEVELDDPSEYSMDGIETFDAWDLEKITESKLAESEHYDNFSKGDIVKTSDGWKGRIINDGEDDQGIFYEVKSLFPLDDGIECDSECYGPEDLTYIGGPDDDEPYMSYDEYED